MENSQRPNVLMICCDHLRADQLGCNGHPLAQTPQIDKLAAQGVNFQRAFSECPVCVPARRIMMTGLNPYHIHMDRNRDTQEFNEGPKLAEVLTKAGYQTFASGKLHTHPQRNRIGFEDVQLNEEGRKQGGLVRDDYEAMLMENGCQHIAYSHGLGNNQYGLRINPLETRFTTTQWTADQAMRFVERRDPTRPFFLYVSFDKPHPPVTPPREYYELFANARFPTPVMGDWLDQKLNNWIQMLRDYNLWDSIKDNEEWIQQNLRGFAAMTTHIDSMVGQIIGTLKENGVLDNTWIVLTSDHGDHLFDHGNFAKGDFFQGSTRVPFIVVPSRKWAYQHMGRGRNDTATPVGLADIMPTLLDICAVDDPAARDGQSLLPKISDPDAAFRQFSFGRCNEHFAVSDGRFRMQWSSEQDLYYLFDQDNDPRDCHDLADDPDYADVRRRLQDALTEWMQHHEDPLAASGTLQPHTVDRNLQFGTARNNWNNRGRHGLH